LINLKLKYKEIKWIQTISKYYKKSRHSKIQHQDQGEAEKMKIQVIQSKRIISWTIKIRILQIKMKTITKDTLILKYKNKIILLKNKKMIIKNQKLHWIN
jgi:hypothetical protein